MTTPQPARKKRGTTPVKIAIIALIAAIVAVAFYVAWDPKPTPPSEEKLINNCFEDVKTKLKDPSSASMLDARVTRTQKTDTSMGRDIEGEFRAKNSFGAYVTGRWTCFTSWYEKSDPNIYVKTEIVE